MIKRSYLFALVIGLLYMGVSNAQYPILDAIANKIAQKYQKSTCEQLWQQKAQKKQPSPQEQEAMQMLRSDPKSLLGMYVPPDPQKMEQAKQAGNMSLNPVPRRPKFDLHQLCATR